MHRFDQLAACGVTYLRLTFSNPALQTYFAERVLPQAAPPPTLVSVSPSDR